MSFTANARQIVRQRGLTAAEANRLITIAGEHERPRIATIADLDHARPAVGLYALRLLAGQHDEPWTPPPTTRWWLEGHHGEDTLTLVTEYGAKGDPACPSEAPERDDYTKPDEAVRPWLCAVVAIGVSTSFEGGAHGWIDHWATAHPHELARRRASA